MRQPLAKWMAGLLILLPAAPVPAAAQRLGVLEVLPQVTHEAFTYTLSGTITVDVLADAPGELRLLRGQPGRIEVTSRALGGFAGSGLAGGVATELRLTAVGAEQVEYLVVVPEDIRVRVRLPDREVSEVFGTMQDIQTYAWGTELPAPGTPSNPAAPARGNAAPAASADALQPAYSAGVAPRLVRIPSAASVRTLRVRVEGERFRVEASRPLTLTPGDPGVLDIRPEGPPLDLVLFLPGTSDAFLLRIAGAPALVVLDGKALALCEPVMEQRLDDGRRWYTFTPNDGRLRCHGDGHGGVTRRSD